jgi:short-subunit dehydrogenase
VYAAQPSLSLRWNDPTGSKGYPATGNSQSAAADTPSDLSGSILNPGCVVSSIAHCSRFALGARRGYVRAMKYPAVLNKTVLVTGCSTGIGAATARTLRDRGWTVIPTARKAADLDRLRHDAFTPVELDIADSASVRHCAEETLRISGGKLGAVVNNAGFGQPGAVEDLTRDAMRYQFEVNVFGLQELANQFIPLFRKQGHGRIVNVSSVLGRITIPFMGIYCASKHAVESLSDALRVELSGSGVAVSIIEPGPIDTSFQNNSVERARTQITAVKSPFMQRYRKQMEGTDGDDKFSRKFSLPPEAVARKIIHALESPRPRTRYPVTVIAWMGEWMHRFAPDWFMDLGMSRRIT